MVTMEMMQQTTLYNRTAMKDPARLLKLFLVLFLLLHVTNLIGIMYLAD